MVALAAEVFAGTKFGFKRVVSDVTDDFGEVLPVADQSVLGVSIRTGVGGEPTIRYSITPAWLNDPARQFPVVIDPTVCLGQGASGCTINYTSGNIDHFITSTNVVPQNWTTFRVGYDVRSDDCCTFGTVRGLVYFKDVTLPDDAVVYDTDLQLHISSEYGGPSGETIYAYRVTKGWSQSTSWSAFSICTVASYLA